MACHYNFIYRVNLNSRSLLWCSFAIASSQTIQPSPISCVLLLTQLVHCKRITFFNHFSLLNKLTGSTSELYFSCSYAPLHWSVCFCHKSDNILRCFQSDCTEITWTWMKRKLSFQLNWNENHTLRLPFQFGPFLLLCTLLYRYATWAVHTLPF